MLIFPLHSLCHMSMAPPNNTPVKSVVVRSFIKGYDRLSMGQGVLAFGLQVVLKAFKQLNFLLNSFLCAIDISIAVTHCC